MVTRATSHYATLADRRPQPRPCERFVARLPWYTYLGSALNLNPLVVLVVTIGAGCLFGMLGLVLAAPLVSAVVKIAKALDSPLEPVPEPPTDPGPNEGDTLIPAG